MLTDFTITGAAELAKILLIVCPLVFFAGFVDAIAGGGGIISLPAYLIAGLPAHFAAGTNKMAACLGTSVSTWKYHRGGKIRWKTAAISACGSLLGAFIGTQLALMFHEDVLKIIIIAALPMVALFLLLKRDFGTETESPKVRSSRANALLALVIGFVIGCYDGLIGPGTGTFLILAFTGILGFDLLTSSGCAKVSNLASNFVSMTLYIINGKTVFFVAIPAALFSIAGNYLGARTALKSGSKIIRRMLFIVLALLFAKLIFDLL